MRTKWFHETEELKEDDLNLIVNEGQRNGWTRGRDAAVIPGCDDRIRQAMIQTNGGLFRYPVTILAELTVQGRDNAKTAPDLRQRYGSGMLPTLVTLLI